MPEFKYNQIPQRIKKNEIDPIYLFFGEEYYLKDEVVHELLSALVDPSLKEFNLDVLHGKEVEPDQLMTILSTPPMMSPRRVVVLKDFDRLPKKTVELLAGYSEKPVDFTVLILIAQKLSAAAAVTKIKKKAATVNFRTLYDNQIPAWINSRCKALGKQISKEAALFLQNYIGNDLARLNQELLKLMMYVDDRKKIEVDDAEKLAGFTRTDTVFDFINALADRNTRRALEMVKSLIRRGESAVGIVALLTTHTMTLGYIAESLRLRMNKQHLLSKLRVHPYFVDRYIEQARQYSHRDISTFMSILLETDTRLKSSSMKDEDILEGMVLEFAAVTK